MMHQPPNEKYWKVLRKGCLKANGTEPKKKFVYSVKRLSDGEIFTIGDLVALSWYPAFIRSYFIREFIKRDNKIYVRYDESSTWELSNTRVITEKEVSQAIDEHVRKNSKK
jgi:hypothetical protein